jgi:TRAP-type mannitol/chloroaromatic compound transport system permease large subunit
MQHAAQAVVPVLLVLFIVYRRIKRTVGTQPFQPRKLKVRTGIFLVVALLLLIAGLLHPILWAADGAGLIAGSALAWLAIRHNRFEWREAGLHYRTHTAIQAVVVALFVGRIAYRFAFAGQQTAASPDNQAQMQMYARDPWTAAVFFVLVAFYIGYYTYILRKGKEQINHENRRPDQTEAS